MKDLSPNFLAFPSDWRYFQKICSQLYYFLEKFGIQRSFLICKTLTRIFPFIEIEAFLLRTILLVSRVVCCTEIFILLNFVFKLPSLLGESTLEYWKKISNPSFEFAHNGICCIFWKCVELTFFFSSCQFYIRVIDTAASSASYLPFFFLSASGH